MASYKKVLRVEKMHQLNAKKIAEITEEYSAANPPIKISFERPDGTSYDGNLVLDLIYNCYRDKAVKIIAEGNAPPRTLEKAVQKIQKFTVENNKKIVLKNLKEKLITG